jgi:hypothetical protein
LIFLDKSKDNGWSCDGNSDGTKCLNGVTDYFQSYGLPRFRCRREECNFDLCEYCMDFFRKKKFYELNESYKVKCHNDPLVYLGISKNYDGWGCDGRDLNEKCFSGNDKVNQMKGFERFKCKSENCNFNLCRYCMDFYLKDN